MREKIVYRHPKGRFEVIERSGTDIFGNLYRIREAQLTPEKDARGRLTDADRKAPELHLDMPEEPPQKRIRKTINQKEGQRICTLWRQGFSTRQIAESCGRAESTINIYLTKKGLREPKDKHPWTEEESELALELWNAGWTLQKIADEMGRSKFTVSLHLRRIGKQTG